ncbi:DNA ligase D [Stenotrophomonas maltophilia]|uniref:DNA ligase (ATP) n=1 Tax=Stenotrophomonas maltophilia TaxID=40324 RepID=A0AAJ2J9D0_STEMA|nr:DNA ligase D [Stenotrophomonas maltophilia]MDT3467306.1 DNA ligase D [Stenotrophomonas maltophilia]
MSLHQYRRKRRLGGGSGQTPEPDDTPAHGDPKRRPTFVIQLHHASSRHYDFRLEMDGVLKSWAVPKGPSLRIGEKRLAVEVEDHPLSYAGFEGDIPEGHYGAGHVEIFDHGTWACEGDPLQALAAGKIDFVLHGQRLAGAWKLVRTAMKGRQVQWLLIKRDDEEARDAEADDLLQAPVPKRSSAAKTRTAGRTERAAPAARRAIRKADARWHARALKLDGARDTPYPRAFKPQLTDHRGSAPDGEHWLHEIKWDGYRLLADLHDGEVKLRSRNGLDWTADFPEVAQAIRALPVRDARLDGELVVLDAQGRSDFAALQRVIDGSSKQPLRYIVFDLPGVAGTDVSRAPLLERKALLKTLLGNVPGILAFSEHVIDHGPQVFAASGKAGFEGIVSKQVDAPYVNARARSWVKVKHEDTDEFVIVGHTAPKGSRVGFGSLLLAAQDKAGLRYVGRVGTGFDDESLRALHKALQPLAVKSPVLPLPAHVPFGASSVRWVKPLVVAEVAFRGWGKEGLLRQASFKRLRNDKQVEDLEVNAADVDAAGEVQITHPERVVFRDQKLSKGDVADYYRQMARWILPEIAGRPLSLLRCPDGAGKACFFQKHHGPGLGDAVHAVPLQQKSGREDYVYIDDARGLLQLVQMNTLELHPWGATVDDPEHPDRLVFDLDPGDGVSWAQVKAGARDVRDRLLQIGLQSFVRLSGGKGVHVVVPLQPKGDWEEAKAFCEAFAQAMALQQPDRYVATMSKAKRSGVIFIDWLRNTRGATSVCSWSLRARASAGVAVPLRWEELAKVTAADAFPMTRALARAKRLKGDPWQGIERLKQTLPPLKR